MTPREGEVLALLAEQLTYVEIGARLFISARTVETHVESLRRQFGARDRRELVQLAAAANGATLPAPLSSFVGRLSERAELADALAGARLVTAVGPGGVGKTRLAQRVAADLVARHRDGTFYVDLVPIAGSDDLLASVARVVAPVHTGSALQTLVAVIGARHVLLLLDNCEHLVDPVARLVEELLSNCPALRVLLTSRSRLLLPHERVYEVPGLDPPSDAADLFLARCDVPGLDRDRVSAVCEALGGLPLAVELAASRLPALGLDGVETALADQASLLVGGARVTQRHRSLEDLVDWSYQLLTEAEQTLFRAVAVFVGPFDTGAAAVVADVDDASAAVALAGLCEHSLLGAIPGDPTRYRALEPVRQSAARIQDPTDAAAVSTRHHAWCASLLESLAGQQEEDLAWCERLDAIAADARAAADTHDDAALGELLGGLLFRRGRLREAQHAFGRAGTPWALERAAAVAECRLAGAEAYPLFLAAAEGYDRLDDPVGAARMLARAVDHAVRFAGMYPDPVPEGDLRALLDRARAFDGASAVVMVAGAHLDASIDLEEILEATREDPVLRSAALDAIVVARVWSADLPEATKACLLRVDPLEPLCLDPVAGLELKDALHTGSLVAVGAGELALSRDLGARNAALPYLREERALAVEEGLVSAALSGDWDEFPERARAYRLGWERSGRPAAPGRGLAPAAIALVLGLQGSPEREDWLEVLAGVRGVPTAQASDVAYGRVFTALLHLHRDDPLAALTLLDHDDPGWLHLLFTSWREALAAEASVLAGLPDAEARIALAREHCATNPVAERITQRAHTLRIGEPRYVDVPGCPYQQARSLQLAGDPAAGIAYAALGISR
ncbi:ATP-binding protein [Ornithinimicrobium sediminis]|uniref:ATP-binding protein n=1 Tax=Ornithinimicrobium sediminis TaxID=2904603 RepID=UPI001E611CF7|nr:LuxR C-terminal-related transcriptional regulator [Ornithinimicrobium sediminis]MCE0487399.1 LuxR C-terminal-related transcriptional regulator [Ornithinimicrobium sediminis]